MFCVKSKFNLVKMRLQTEYSSPRRTIITLHVVPLDRSEDHLGAFVAQYEQVAGHTGEKQDGHFHQR